jgi:predicted lipoprotein with Yx(FWY)xxD motif
VPLFLALLAAAVLAGAGPASAANQAATVQMAQDTKLGSIFTDAAGMTLYVYTKDSPGISNCYDKCATNWPPLLLKTGEQPTASADLKGTLGTTTRKDGTVQATYNGAPLYYWVKDKIAGDTTGHKVGGVWFVVEPGLLPDTAGTWEQSAVAAAVRGGWVKGDPNGAFRPEDQLTRAEFVRMLAAAFATPAASLSDQSEPDRAITREEAAAMVVRTLGMEARAAEGQPAVARFADAQNLSARSAGLVGVAVQLEIVKGYPDNTVHGEQTATRAEAVVLIQRALSVKK